MIADTSFLIDLLTGDEDALKRTKEIENNRLEIATTTITVFEMWSSANIMTKQERDKLEELFTRMRIETHDVATARDAGLLHAQLRSKGCEIGEMDCLIASLCLRNNESLITRNIKHFSRVQGLKIEEY